MPPSTPSSEQHVSADDQAPLSDQDVEILHLIITTAQYLIVADAQQHPNGEPLPTFKALFAAYDTVLEQTGVDPWHDQVYFRFLLRMGGWSGATLYAKFEALLEKMGIRLEFDGEGQGPQEITRDLRDVNEGEGWPTSQSKPQSVSPRGKVRRASFNSMYDVGDAWTQATGRRIWSASLESGTGVATTAGFEGRPSSRATTRKTERTQSQRGRDRATPTQSIRGGLTALEHAQIIQHYQRGEKPLYLLGSPQPSNQSWAEQSHGIEHGRPQSAQMKEWQGRTEANAVLVPGAQRGLRLRKAQLSPPVLLHHLSEKQMAPDADVLYRLHVESISRRILRQWRDSAFRVLEDHQNMEAIAITRDSDTLLRQAVDQWRVALHEKRQEAETERFFSYSERRAGKARDLFLLTKAFTHWASSASEEVLRTSVARRHLLRSKYFNSWLGITVVNEFKVRRQGLKKFFITWKKRYIRMLADSIKAVTVCNRSLTERVYWRWFWTFCERRAPQWGAEKLRTKCFKTWVKRIRESRSKEEWVEGVWKRAALKKYLAAWSAQARDAVGRNVQADQYRRAKLAARMTKQWCLQSRFLPGLTTMSILVDWRVAGKAFGMWRNRIRMETQAAEVDHWRILGKAWSSWNEHLRWQTIVARSGDRVVLKALYKWVLAERFALLRRHFARRLKGATLTKLVQRWKILQEQHYRSEYAIRHKQDRSILRSVIFRWKLQMQLCKQREQLAFEFNVPKIGQETIQVLQQRLENVRQLQKWAKDAQFYFLTMKTFRRWQAAVADSKRQKRRHAYGRIRRIDKINLGGRHLAVWLERTNYINNMRRQAHDICHRRAVTNAISHFHTWRSQVQITVESARIAEATYRQNLLRRQFRSWTNLMQQRRDWAGRASYFLEMHISSLAAGLLRKLSLRVFEFKTQQEKADSWSRKKNKMHFRNIFGHWIERTTRHNGQQQLRLFGRSTIARNLVRAVGDAEGGLTGRAEDWTAFDEGFDFGIWNPSLEAQSSSTPLPGYLATPSKRAARAKVLVQLSTTPLGTPFEHRLRSQMAIERASSKRKHFDSWQGSSGRTG